MLTTGDSYRPVALPPVSGAMPVDAALAPPQAAASVPAELPTATAGAAADKQGDGYDF